ncbi:PQQ-binding-like beta-propeller repeat protein, partial [bacterium]|nr:PQQ-binding-like beta-propeller repeat protein [bacterium]
AEARRRRREAAHGPPARAADDRTWREVREVVDAELAALPEAYRTALVLCYLQELGYEDAAARAGCSVGALRGRLERGKEALRRRLARRGLPLLAPALVAGRPEPSAAALVDATLAVVRALRAGGRIPAAVAELARPRGGIRAAVLPVAVGLAAVGALLAGAGPSSDLPPPARAVDPPGPRTDLFGDPLPDGAVLRLGSVLFRHAGAWHFALLPDGKSVLSAGSDGRLRTWDLATGRETRSVPEPGSGRGLLALSADGRYAAGLVGTDLAVLETETGTRRASFPAPGKDFHSTFFSPDGGTLAVLTWEPRLALVEWGTGRRRELTLPPRAIGRDSSFHGYFSGDGKWVVAGGGSGEAVCVFDAATGAEKHRLNCSAAHSAVTPDGKTLVASAWKPDGPPASDLVTFDLATGREAARFDLGGRGAFHSLDVSPDGKTLACSFSDTSCLVDLATGRVRHELPGRPGRVAFTRDGRHVVASNYQKLRVWGAVDGKERFDRPGNLGNLSVLAASPDGRWLASADWLEKGVAVWSLTDGRLARTLPFPGDEGRYVRAVGFSPDGRSLWAGGYTGFVQWWDAATWNESRSVRLKTPATNGPAPDYLYQIRVSPDGRAAHALARVMGRPETTGLAVWDTASGDAKWARSLPAEQRQWAWEGGGAAVALPTPDGLVVADGADPSRTRFEVPGVARNAPVAFSADGRLVATGKATGQGPATHEALLVESATGAVAAEVRTGPVDHLALAGGGRLLVATGGGSLRVFDTTTGGERGRRPLPASATGLLVPDERRAVTALADGTGLAWDLTAFAAPPGPRTGTATELWDALGGPAAAAHQAGWELAGRPAEAVAILRGKVKPVRAADAATVGALVSKLDAPAFADREAATKTLQGLGAAAAPVLRAALRETTSPERASRLGRLLAVMDARAVPSGEEVREVRAVAVLERAATADARALLTALAGGLPDARLTREAAAALARLTERPR